MNHTSSNEQNVSASPCHIGILKLLAETTDDYSVPEEELICWSEASKNAPLNEVGFKCYMELFKQVLPEESKALLL